ncbi:hypothetical protein PRUB_a4080 [Pseudoalteromonas rubra]|uniref:Uncharacterized protein n=1 Tax=Pseudoalteromonas rubra TaxID=43658 RepID=A0A8T0CAV4_9GAMM|nr:hypothetical protein [Pseudoalteromonas rubra]KAF7787201.1 hypothetical protein PRUB_a4080 [Pseudoalteromonas rubra]
MIEINGTLLEQFVWTDEFNYLAVTEQSERALNGATHTEKTAIPVGRPITLQSDLESATIYKALFEHAKGTLTDFPISIRGTDYQVMWDHSQQPVTGTPVALFSDAESEHFQDVILKLKTV